MKMNNYSFFLLLIGFMCTACNTTIKHIEDIDVVEYFLEQITSGNKNIYNAYCVLEETSYEDFDLFISDIPSKSWKSTASYQDENYHFEDISVKQIDTIAFNKYQVTLLIGKKTKKIELEVTESNRLVTHLHGTGIPGRYHFKWYYKSAYEDYSYSDIYIYRTPAIMKKLRWEEHNPEKVPYRPEWFPSKPLEPKYKRVCEEENKHFNTYYILKEQGKYYSKVSYIDGHHPPYVGWVDNGALVRTEEYKGSYTMQFRDYALDVAGIILLGWIMMGGIGGVAGGSAASTGGNVVVIVF